MPEPERRPDDPRAEPPTAEEVEAMRDEDAFDDAETAREAREEAERLDAIPWGRLEKEEKERED